MGVHAQHRAHHRPTHALHWLQRWQRHGLEVEWFGWVVLLGALISYAALRAELSALVLAVIGLGAVIVGLHWRGLAG
jgi:hypothetical protein